MTGNLTGLDQVDKNLKGNSVQFYVGDLDMDGYGDIREYREIRSPSGQTVELWKSLQEIKKLTMEYTEAEKKNNMLVDLSTPSSEQRVADLKKLADELVNVYKLAPDVVLIGAESSNELIGRLVKATFNSDGQIFIIEAGSAIND